MEEACSLAAIVTFNGPVHPSAWLSCSGEIYLPDSVEWWAIHGASSLSVVKDDEVVTNAYKWWKKRWGEDLLQAVSRKPFLLPEKMMGIYRGPGCLGTRFIYIVQLFSCKQCTLNKNGVGSRQNMFTTKHKIIELENICFEWHLILLCLYQFGAQTNAVSISFLQIISSFGYCSY